VIKSRAAAGIAILGVLVSGVNGFATERFQKLGGAQIRARFVGMEMTDNVHWADVFGPNGDLKTYSMGRKKDGKWRIENDELCVDRGKDHGGCYQVCPLLRHDLDDYSAPASRISVGKGHLL